MRDTWKEENVSDGFSGTVNFAVNSPYFFFFFLQYIGKYHFTPQGS